MSIRYGVIGSGMMGHEHIRNIALIDGAEVSAVSDPDEGMRNSAAKATGGRAFSDHKDLLSAGICDAYLIASPNDTHHEILLDVLKTSKPVLVEKPMCTTVAHCEEVQAIAQTREAPVWVAMEYRYMPPTAQLIDEVRAGTAGTPRMVSIREHRFPFLEKVGDWNRFNERTGGTLVEKCCHFWDLMRLLMEDDPVRVYASAGVDVNHLDETYDGRTPDIIDNAFVTLEFSRGGRGMLDLCMFAEGSYWQEIVSVTGAKARVDAHIPGPARFNPDGKERTSQVVISDRASKEVTTKPVHVDELVLTAGDHHGSTYFQHQRFFEMVRSGSCKPEVSAEDGLWSVRIGAAAEESARTGQAVAL